MVSSMKWDEMTWKKKIVTILAIPFVPIVTKIRRFWYEVKLAQKLAEDPQDGEKQERAL